MSAMRRFATHSRTNPKKVVEININTSDVSIIDLTDPKTLDDCIPPLPGNERARNFATKFEEVLVEGFIPPHCITNTFYL
jgi:hypothetical protein